MKEILSGLLLLVCIISVANCTEFWERLLAGGIEARHAFPACTWKNPDAHVEGMLVHGGWGSSSQNNYLDDLQWFNPVTSEWTEIDQGDTKLDPRSGHTIAVDDNTVYLFGGTVKIDNSKLETVNELFAFDLTSTATEKWTQLGKDLVDLPTPRSDHGMIMSGDSIYIFGGATEMNNVFVSLNDVWEYKVSENKWSKIEFGEEADVPAGRFSFGYTSVTIGSKTYMAIFGGYTFNPDSSSTVLGDLWLLDLESKEWINVDYDGPPFTRAYTSMTSIGSKLWMFGGFARMVVSRKISGFVFGDLLSIDMADYGVDPTTKPRWFKAKTTSQVPVRYEHAMTAVNDGQLLVYGGKFQTVYSDLWAIDSTVVPMIQTEESDFEPITNEFDTTTFIIALVFCLVLFVVIFCASAFLRGTPMTSENAATNARIIPRGVSKRTMTKLPVVKFKEEETDDVCAICLAEYTKNDELRLLPCKHRFHPNCIESWLAEHKSCPMCKRAVDRNLKSFIKTHNQEEEHHADGPSIFMPSTHQPDSESRVTMTNVPPRQINLPLAPVDSTRPASNV
eukprot:TRINITY_DN15159_c0_g1_i1.p1 TRINITY_DN15159_c0_g1~~TRINITY_DN15159_c0_g1_i1.p1  ORF type:complete len:562 (-),score=146.10 TRINITY_DN15159_c0_g1_i1:939-2624(-)